MILLSFFTLDASSNPTIGTLCCGNTFPTLSE
uniref:Uncharacterized protein n=1 Tax=Rhizophora mucronata TaxID=61149 RepID=A0A2P2PLI4_RHIMU